MSPSPRADAAARAIRYHIRQSGGFWVELFLNAIWLAASVLVVLGCLRFRVRSPDSRDGLLRALLVAGCLVVLLFPVISASDDLHALAAPMEDSSRQRRTLETAGNEGPAIASLAAILVLLALLKQLLHREYAVAVPILLVSSVWLSSPTSERAPPCLSPAI